MGELERADIIIKAAAVADYRPKQKNTQKIKKNDHTLTIELEKNIDILSELGKVKDNKILIGFAAETSDLIANAKEKIVKKNLDMIVANDVTLPGAGFNHDTNIVKIIDKSGQCIDVPLCNKDEVAQIILDRILSLIKG